MNTYVEELLVKLCNDDKRILCILSDCGSDIVKFSRLMNIPHLPWLAHVLNLVAKTFLQSSMAVTSFEIDDDNSGDELDLQG